MSGRLKVVSIGAAVMDVFLRGKIFEPNKEQDGSYSEEFKLGTKNEVEAITYSTGGGATNASVTFARQDIASFYMGYIGDDIAGKAIKDELRRENVDMSLTKINSEESSGYSTILLAPNGERTILTYRGASKEYKFIHSDFLNIAPDWFYVSSLSGDIDSLETIVEYAEKNHINIAINPGSGEISHKRFLQLLKSFKILSLNKEEMQKLFGADLSIKELLIVATKYVPIVLLTDGPKGSYVCDGQNIYKAGMYEDVTVIDRAGAGDAFSSGFVSKIITGHTIEEALTFASANSTSVVTKIGAKAGILKKGHPVHRMKIDIKQI